MYVDGTGLKKGMETDPAVLRSELVAAAKKIAEKKVAERKHETSSLRDGLRDGAAIAGMVLVIYGISLWSIPAAFIAAGIVLFALSVLTR